MRNAIVRVLCAAITGVALAAHQGTPPPPPTPPTTTPPTTSPVGGSRTFGPKPAGSPVRADAAVIVGQVVDSSGRPVERAAVRLIGDSIVETVLTDPRGRFFFRSIPPGDAIVTAQKFGYYDGAYGKRRANGQPLPFTLGMGQVLTDMRIEIFGAGVITGSVADELGEPIPAARVVVSRRQFVGGNWEYVIADTDTTDDEGVYRIFGLRPGEYIVATPATSFSMPVTVMQAMGKVGLDATDTGAGMTSNGRDVVWSTGATPPDDDGVGGIYPTQFYPATEHRILALPITLGSGDVRYAVNFRLPLVPARRVSGQLVGEPSATAHQVLRLMPAGGGAVAGDEAATTLSDADGRFSFARVPSGVYVLETGSETTMRALTATNPGLLTMPATTFWGAADVNVGDMDVDVPTIPMRPTVGILGQLFFETPGSTTTAVPPPSRVPITIEPSRPGLSIAATVRPLPSGAFGATNVVPGEYFIRVGALPPGWFLKSVTAGGRDALDDPIDVGEAGLDSIVVRLTTKGTQMTGVVRDARQQAAVGAAIIILPVTARGDAVWTPNRTRETRASASGVFVVTGLPPGEYFVIAIDDAAAEGWQDPRVIATLRTLATRVALKDQENKIVQMRLSVVKR